jgi:hypothetical protein
MGAWGGLFGVKFATSGRHVAGTQSIHDIIVETSGTMPAYRLSILVAKVLPCTSIPISN